MTLTNCEDPKAERTELGANEPVPSDEEIALVASSSLTSSPVCLWKAAAVVRIVLC